jgi:hypothetical protein
MTLEPLTGFQHFTTHHCITGSMQHIYVFNSHPLSEEMLLGLGAGVGYVYWHTKNAAPFIGGRGNVRGEFEPLVGQRSGVTIEVHTTGSARKAEETLLAMLDAGQPVMIHLDMGFLPYLDFGGSDYHFGGHAVVVCGYDAASRQALVADRDPELHPVSMDVLAQARGSTHKPFPAQNRWYTFDFSNKREPTAGEVRQAIVEAAQGILEPPISNFGVPGIRKTAQRLPKWPQALDAETLRWTLFNTYIFIAPVGGSGGGLFRYMYGRFLRQAAEITGDRRLIESADEFQRIGDRWQALGEWFHQTSKAPDPATQLKECVAPLDELADLEEAAWTRLRQQVE